MPRLVFCWEVGYADLPNVESPSIARFWFESNPHCTESLPSGTGPSGGFGLTDPSHAMEDEHLFRRRWVDEIDSGRMVLLNDGPASDPAVTLRNGRWQPSSDLSNPEAELNVREMIEQAERSRLTHMPILAPRPEAQKPVAKQQARTEKGTGIALLPVRYAVGRRAEDEEPYGYDSPTLAGDFPELQHARYVLRTLRSGHLYVLYEDDLFGFSVSATGRIRPQEKGKDTNIRVNGDALIFPEDGKNVEVLIAFSEQEWPPSQRQKILDDQDGCRNRQMQRFALESPEQDSFPLAELASRVEEYGGYASQYRWSKYSSLDRDAADRMTGLKKRAGAGQHVIALHDPVAMTHELGCFIEEELEALRVYVSEPDTDSSAQAKERYRKKVIADAIDRLYESRFAQKYHSGGNAAGSAGDELTKLAELRQETFRREPANRGKRVPSVAEFRREVLADDHVNPEVARFKKHIDDEGRQFFLTMYELNVARLQRHIRERKADRAAWLASGTESDSPRHLGSAWATYDLDDAQQGEAQWMQYEASCAASIRAATAIACSEEEAAEEPEYQLIGQWLSMSAEESPIYRALLGHKELRDTIDGAKDRLGQLTGGTATFIHEIYKKLPVTIATEEIVRNVFNYTLKKPKNWRGAVLTTMDDYIGRMLGADSDTAQRLLHTLMSRHGQHITWEKQPIGTLTRNLVGSTGNPAIRQEMEPLTRSGRLAQEGITQFEITDITVRTTEAPLGKRYPNPMLGWGSAGVSSFVGLLNVANISIAVDQLTGDNDLEEWVNLGSALMSMGAAVNEGINAYAAALKPVDSFVKNNALGRILSATLTTRVFGHGGALLTGITMLIKGKDHAEDGDLDAGAHYAASGATLFAGGVILTEVSVALMEGTTLMALGITPMGWLIIGMILVGVSIWLLWEAENATDTAIERWLDAGSFGIHERQDQTPYTSLEEEQEAMVDAFYAPKVLSAEWEDRWGWEDYFAQLELLLPGYHTVDSQLKVTANGKVLGNGELSPGKGGTVSKYKLALPKENGSSVTFRISYRPSENFQKTLSLDVTLPGNN